MGGESREAESVCRFLDWDSQFFGFRIGRVVERTLSLEEMEWVSAWCQRESIRCLYFECDPGDDSSVRLAERTGFQLVDVRLEFSKRMAPETVTSTWTDGLRIRQWVEADLPTLGAISETAYRDTRFWHDLNFPRERVTALYRDWIINSCHGFADRVFVADYDGEPVGFLTCGFDSPNARRIGLVGVSSEARGKGVGRALVEAAIDDAISRGCELLEVATQARNISAQRLYQRSGFTTCSTSLWYHLWR
jgi:GNAT superfamily N-acetyltransferase